MFKSFVTFLRAFVVFLCLLLGLLVSISHGRQRQQEEVSNDALYRKVPELYFAHVELQETVQEKLACEEDLKSSEAFRKTLIRYIKERRLEISLMLDKRSFSSRNRYYYTGEDRVLLQGAFDELENLVILITIDNEKLEEF